MINPLGAVVLFDGENPRTFTGKARTALSGGDLVQISGAANFVSSGADSFVAADIVVDLLQDSDRCNGIVLQNAESGANVTVATRGTYIARCAGIISGGQQVVGISGTTQGIGAFSTSVSYSGTSIGRTWGDSASGTNLFTVFSLNV